MLSALQHYSYCPRQCALIHQEQSFEDNEFTLRGKRAHQRVDGGESGVEDGVQIVRSLPLYSEKLGLLGKADVVEFRSDGTPYPVEYKQGRRHRREHDDIQLAAQAVCLEEMTGREVREGAIYHHQSKRRRVVEITPALREEVARLTQAVRCMLADGRLPPPTDDPALCRACSLREICQPELASARKRIHALSRALFTVDESPE